MDLRLTTMLLTALYIGTAAGMFGLVYYVFYNQLSYTIM